MLFPWLLAFSLLYKLCKQSFPRLAVRCCCVRVHTRAGASARTCCALVGNVGSVGCRVAATGVQPGMQRVGVAEDGTYARVIPLWHAMFGSSCVDSARAFSGPLLDGRDAHWGSSDLERRSDSPTSREVEAATRALTRSASDIFRA